MSARAGHQADRERTARRDLLVMINEERRRALVCGVRWSDGTTNTLFTRCYRMYSKLERWK